MTQYCYSHDWSFCLWIPWKCSLDANYYYSIPWQMVPSIGWNKVDTWSMSTFYLCVNRKCHLYISCNYVIFKGKYLTHKASLWSYWDLLTCCYLVTISGHHLQQFVPDWVGQISLFDLHALAIYIDLGHTENSIILSFWVKQFSQFQIAIQRCEG